MAQKYKLVYCAKIDDDKHAGMLKVGDTEFTPTKQISSYIPNESALQREAEARIRSWSGTAAAGAELVYCEALIRYNNKTQNHETYRDTEIHAVLQQAGFPKVDFDSANDSGREWFMVDLETVKAAIRATKEFRTYLDTSELPTKSIYNLREEQAEAVKMTKDRFRRNNDMLWHAKMRFGKTITALNLVKEMGFRRTIIITHRPVVEDSWGSDFYHVFSKEDKYVFLTKIREAESVLDDDETNEAADKANDVRLAQLVAENKNFVYFASIQDLRGSKEVGGRFQKNGIVFETDWDFVIIDEAHEGTKTDLGQKVIERLIKKGTKRLDLSGTAYNLLDRYNEKDSIFTWDYVMEQEAKLKWPEKHPDEKNPYEDMPVMHINTFDLERAIIETGIDLAGKTFSFREFFRTWTGDLSKDGQSIPQGCEMGDFVHPDAVRRFLDLLSVNDEKSRFPYVTKSGVAQNAHSLWMVPGVKEAAALSKMLKKHPWFGQESLFGIANIAGEGDHDEEKHYQNALAYVRKTIENHPCSITISCGRLTTGVTVKEWSSVFMLSGSETTDAKAYMQTIFRVQSAGKINGIQKRDAYVYDFAPDRTLLVIAESIVGVRHGRTGTVVDDDDQHGAFEDFLKFCPVIAIDGAEFKPFSVESLVSQINRVQIDRALKTGFMDNGIYDMSKFKSLSDSEIERMNTIFEKLKETKGKGPLTSAGMADNGTEKGERGKRPSRKSPSKNEKKKEQKELEKAILEKLRTISIRIPLLFYGGDFEIEEGRLGQIITGIDQASWDVFMPEKLTKKDFLELVKYYNQQTVLGAGRIIRDKARKADELTPTERVIAITDIFDHFHNPSKETVLTPWRVVNMQLSDTLGGWCFYNELFEENTDDYYRRLLEPRFVDRGEVTDRTVGNPNATILEINSKTGLYPLYAAYSIYKAKLGDRLERDLLPEELVKIWDEAVSQVYVLCQSSMAAEITKRTLVGWRSVKTNVKFDSNLLDRLKASVDKVVKHITKGSYWGNEVPRMKFDAIIGNPPYQSNISVSDGNAAMSKQVFPAFIEAAISAQSTYVSLITPSRWFTADAQDKSFIRLREFLKEHSHFKKLYHYANNKDIFPNVAIAGGVNYFLYDKTYSGNVTFYECVGNEKKGVERPLFEENLDIVLSMNEFVSILNKVRNSKDFLPMSTVVEGRNPFGVVSKESVLRKISTSTPFDGAIELRCAHEEIRYIKRESVKKNAQLIDKWKVFTSKGNGGAGVLNAEKPVSIMGRPYIGKPGSICSESLIPVGSFETENEALNLQKYMSTKFFRFMVGILKVSQNIYQNVYQFVPMFDFTVDSCIRWGVSISEIDQQLYHHFKLTNEEVEIIEGMIKPMVVES